MEGGRWSTLLLFRVWVLWRVGDGQPCCCLECGSYGGWEMVNLVAVQIGVTFRIVWVCCT